MYDIIEPNTKRVNAQNAQINDLEKQLKKANLGNQPPINNFRNPRVTSIPIQRKIKTSKALWMKFT